MFFATMLAFSAMFASCDKEEVISETKLPASSQEFIKTHFPNVAVTCVVKETDGVEKDYTVYLANGFDIDFERNGNWDDVDGHINPLPQSVLSLLPAGISEYVSVNFKDYKIVEANKERYGYEIGLNGEIDLKFNGNGGFIGYDD
ncbi:MAG: PepSY-like domain-containing protein [Tannerellaceae bacterium]|nr:PepSY-like domain-containing protein [Tannerellaceae bacterium]